MLGGEPLTPEQAQTSGRLALAEWITDVKNPADRACVRESGCQNTISGRESSGRRRHDFGKQSKPATNPELLDFLTAWFVRSGYSVKTLQKVIMSSKAYQMSCEELPANLAKDGANELLWHFNRERLEAEEIRDAILTVSGELDRARPGGHPFPPQEKWDFTQHKAFAAVYEDNHRSVYQMTQRIKKHPFFGLFDGPDTNACTGERVVSTTPLQSLFLMNDPFLKEQSKKLAARLVKSSMGDGQRVTNLYWFAYQRGPTPEDSQEALSFLNQFAGKLRAADFECAVGARTQNSESFAALSRVIFCEQRVSLQGLAGSHHESLQPRLFAPADGSLAHGGLAPHARYFTPTAAAGRRRRIGRGQSTRAEAATLSTEGDARHFHLSQRRFFPCGFV